MACDICGAKSHSTSKCPKGEKKDDDDEGGRGLTLGNKTDLAALEACIEKLEKDTEGLYDDGAKSLVGGYKGKPSGLKDTSYRIDRQAKGNVQFQKGKVSMAKVSFGPTAKPATIIHGLRTSMKTGEEVEI